MPIQECTLPEGGKGYRWGNSGKCFADRKDAEKQAEAAYANGYTGDVLALDRASVRNIDQDGHLHVAQSNISRANVCPYYGREIPDYQSLGLNPDEVYKLYRDPAALAKAAPTFDGKQLLLRHKPQTADDHDHDITIGAVYNVEFKDPHLQAELVVWPGDAIDLIQSGEQRQLSCGYYYKAIMEAGVTPSGEVYDGRMDQIIGNHVAVVVEGRAGPTVIVGDSALSASPIPDHTPAATPELQPDAISQPSISETQSQVQETKLMAFRQSLSRQALIASGALGAYLPPKMATDAKLDFNSILKGVTAKNWKASKAKIKVALDKALEGKLAADADISDVVEMLNRLPQLALDEDKEDKKEAEDEEDDDKKDDKKKAAEDEDDDEDDDTAMDADKDDDDKAAEDEEDDDKKDDDDKPAFLKGKDRKGARDKKGAKDKAKDAEMPVAGKEPTIKKSAMDAAIASAVKLATRTAETNTIARLRSIAEAEKAVRPYIGELAIAQDSAEDVYRLALDAAEVDLDGVPPAAFAAMVKMLPLPGATKPAIKAKMSFDSAANADMLKRFPGVNSLKHR
jgi:hypothetical protein